jgi:hypothetical protein
MVLRYIVTAIAWIGLLFGVWLVSRLLLRFVHEPSLRGISAVLQSSHFVLLPAGVLIFISRYRPFSEGLLEQIPGVWLFGVALAAYVLGDWLEQRMNRVE